MSNVLEGLTEAVDEIPVDEPVVEETPAVEEAPEERRVSIHALHEERERRKDAEQQLGQLRDQAARMEERFSQFQQQWQQRQQQPEEEVSFDDNPAEYLKKQTDTLNKQTENLRALHEQQTQQQQQQQAYQQFYQQVSSREQEFAAEHPDYFDAVQHLRQSRYQEYEAAGYTPEQVRFIVDQEAHDVAANALRNNQNPAESFYKLATLRGWANDINRLETVKRGVETNRTLGTSGESGGRVTLASLAAMDDSEFEAATQGGNWRKLMDR